jgi:hypothetical protein
VSPSRAKARRAPQAHHRSRQELATAIGGAAAVVIGTALLIWLMRPGDVVTPGSGGLIHRQPRISWLVFIAIVVEISAVAWVSRSRRYRENPRVPIIVSSVVVVVLAIAAGFAWPSGAVRHYETFNPSDITIPSTAPTPTTQPTATTKPTATTTPASTTTGATPKK